MKANEYVYSEATTNSTKKWWFKKNTLVTIKQPGPEGWVKIVDTESRGGWVRLEVLDKP